MTSTPRLAPYWSFSACRSNRLVRGSGRTRARFKPRAPNRSEDAFIAAVWAIGDTLNRGSGTWGTRSPSTALPTGYSGKLLGRINGSIVCRMKTRSLSANQLAALSELIATPATKAKASITLSGNLLKVVDSLAGEAQRSAWIERAVQSYARRQLKERRRERELVLLNKHADALNAEGDDSATYQASWTAE